MRNTKWPGGSLNIQFNGVTVVSPERNTFPSGLRLLGQQNIRSPEQEANIFLVGH